MIRPENDRFRHLRRGLLAVATVALVACPWNLGVSAQTNEPTTTPADAVSGLVELEVPAEMHKAAVLQLQGEITDVMGTSLKRRIDQAVADGVDVIVFDMDTPGGLVTSSIDIADMIRELTKVKTVAWVNPNAHSGGSIVAVACDEIVMTRSSRMGDSQVIMGGPTGATAVPEDLEAKAYTPVLGDFRQSAKKNGYSHVLCESFVLPDREVWWIEHKETGEKRFVFREEKIKLVGDEDATAADTEPEEKADADEGDEDKPKTESTKGSSQDDKEVGDKENEKEDEPAKVYDWQLVKTYYDAILESDTDTIQPIVPQNQLLEMSAGEAMAYGFSKAIVSNEAELTTHYDLASITQLAPTWSENLAYWLTSMYVRGFLMLLILLGAYVEFNTPGVGVPGLAALVCLTIFVGAPYLTGLADVWEIIFILVGFGLIGVEIFVIPGFGVAGVSGILLVLVGLLATFVPTEPGRSFPIYIPSMPDTMRFVERGVITLASSLLMSLVGMYMISRYLPKTPLFRRIAPANPTPSDVLTEDPYRGAARVGDIGDAQTVLRPAGKAMFGNMLVDVATRGEILEPPCKIEVIERRGNHVVVREAPAAG